MLTLVFDFEQKAAAAVAAGADIEEISNLPVREQIGRFKAVPYADYRAESEKIKQEISRQLDALTETVEA
jgi:V/A-type H+-transporting ATPase subunit A